jgi:hypothetical protein
MRLIRRSIPAGLSTGEEGRATCAEGDQMGFLCSAILIGSMSLSPTVMTGATESSCMKRSNCSTRDFLRMCDAPAPSVDCLWEYQMLTLAATSTGNPGYRVCQPSANASATELAASLSKEVKQIVAWLKAHPDLADLQDVNSVTAAVQAIYPCH